MTEEEKQALLWSIATKVAQEDTTKDADGDLECVFCSGDQDYGGSWRSYKHNADCVVLLARKLVEETEEPQKEQEKLLWACDHCKKVYCLFDPKMTIVIDNKANKGVTVCASCHKELWRAKRIAMEYK